MSPCEQSTIFEKAKKFSLSEECDEKRPVYSQSWHISFDLEGKKVYKYCEELKLVGDKGYEVVRQYSICGKISKDILFKTDLVGKRLLPYTYDLSVEGKKISELVNLFAVYGRKISDIGFYSEILGQKSKQFETSRIIKSSKSISQVVLSKEYFSTLPLTEKHN